MTAILLVILLGIIASIVAIRRGMKYARALLVALMILGVAVAAAKWLSSPTLRSVLAQRLDDELSAGSVLGAIIAQQIPGGTVLVLRHPPSDKRGQRDLTQTRFDGLAKAFNVAAYQIIQAGPASGGAATDDSSFTLFSEERFDDELAQWCTKHPDVKAVVSLLPLAPQFRSMNIPFYAFFAGRDDSWADGIKNGQIKAAILYRRPPIPADLKPAANDGLPPKYKLVTPANLDEALKDRPSL